ncbi:Docking protein 3 [Sparganum proliferum]
MHPICLCLKSAANAHTGPQGKLSVTELFFSFSRRFGCVGGVLRVDAGRRCSTGDGKFFFDCSPTKGQSVDSLGAQIRQLVLEASNAFVKSRPPRDRLLSPRGCPTALPQPSTILASAPAHDLCQFRPNPLTTLLGVKKGRRTSSTSRPFVLPPSQLPVDVVKTESAEFRVNQGPSGGSPTAAVSDRVQETAIDAVGMMGA